MLKSEESQTRLSNELGWDESQPHTYADHSSDSPPATLCQAVLSQVHQGRASTASVVL